jgi:beta-1,4-N-acetylglucosaminyltransferase
MRIGVPLIVVPNPSLLDHHQDELADELVRQGYVTKGVLPSLEVALLESDIKSKNRLGWPPAAGSEDPVGKGMQGVLDEELGYENQVRATLD